MFEELEEQLPVPPFTPELRMTVGKLLGWLLE